MFNELFPLGGIRALVKMDVEGAELMALAGMHEFLRSNHVVIQIETTPQTLEPVEAVMREADYHALGRLGADVWYGNI